MDDERSSESPLDALADVIGNDVVRAFESVGNETRLAILLALWEAKDLSPRVAEYSEPAVSFSQLRERVGTRDSGQFNYHLDKLVGRFIRQTEDGYTLTESAEQFLHAVLAGTFRDHASFESEPIDAECNRCGGPMVIDYSDGILTEHCTSCEGYFQTPDQQAGVNARSYRPPAGLPDRTPEEFHRHGNTWNRHRIHSMLEGVCPDCAGSVTTSIHVCEDHNTDDGTICNSCGSYAKATGLFVCKVCRFELYIPATSPIWTEMAVKAFFYDHGFDTEARTDASETKALHDAIKEEAVTAEDPLELTVVIELDGDQLEVTLDEEARVIDVTEEVQDTD